MPEPQLICTVKATIGLAHAEPKRGDTRRIHLVGDDIDAAEDDLVEGGQAQTAAAPAAAVRIARRDRPA